MYVLREVIKKFSNVVPKQGVALWRDRHYD